MYIYTGVVYSYRLYTLYLIYVGRIYGTHHHIHRHILGAYIANGVVLQPVKGTYIKND